MCGVRRAKSARDEWQHPGRKKPCRRRWGSVGACACAWVCVCASVGVRCRRARLRPAFGSPLSAVRCSPFAPHRPRPRPPPHCTAPVPRPPPHSPHDNRWQVRQWWACHENTAGHGGRLRLRLRLGLRLGLGLRLRLGISVGLRVGTGRRLGLRPSPERRARSHRQGRRRTSPPARLLHSWHLALHPARVGALRAGALAMGSRPRRARGISPLYISLPPPPTHPLTHPPRSNSNVKRLSSRLASRSCRASAKVRITSRTTWSVG